MASVPLVHAQFVPPRVPDYLLRIRLRKDGLSIPSHRVTCVVAPAGYGKSVWVSSLLEEPGWPRTAWLSLDRHDCEPSFLLFHLIYALRKVLPRFGVQCLRTMNSLEDVRRDWPAAAATLIEELPPEEELVLVLDDFHLVDEGETVRHILEYFLRWLPAGVHLVLIARHDPRISLYRERLAGDLLEIRGEKLLFSLVEVGEFFALFGLGPTEQAMDLVYNRTEGWAVGLRLLAVFLRQTGGDAASVLAEWEGNQAGLYTYLGNTLLDHLSPELRDFLLDASLLPYLGAGLVDAALQSGGSALKIRDLHAFGLLSRTGYEEETFRLHHLVGDFLAQRVMQLRPPDYVVALRRRAAAFLEQEGDVDRALEQLTKGKEWDSAAGLITRCADRYFLRGARLDSLEAWLGRLPPELVAGDHRLLYFQGLSMLHTRPEEALATLSRVADQAGGQGDIQVQLRSLLALIYVYCFTNNVKKIQETARRIPVAGALFKSSWSRGVVLFTALTRAAWEDNLRQGVWLSRLAGQAQLDPEPRMVCLIQSSIIQYRLGNLAAAGELAQKALDDPYVRENDRWTGIVLALQAIIGLLAGEHGKVVEICREGLRLGQKYRAPLHLGNAHRRLALLALWAGRLDEARSGFEQAKSAFVEGNNFFHTRIIDLDLMLVRVRAGENAAGLLPEVDRILDGIKDHPGGVGLNDYALSVAGIIAMEAGRLDLARRRFEQVSANCQKKGARQVLAGSQLFLARLCLLEGDGVAADGYLRKVLGAAEAGKWEFFWDWHAETVYSLCRRALLKKIHPAWASHLLRRWFPQRIYKEAGPLLVYPDEGVRRDIALLVQDLGRETGVPVVHVNYLGGFRVFVNGVEVPPSRWKTRKAENLGKFLLIDRRRHPKEELIAALWPESDPRPGDANLRMALTHLRQALNLPGSTAEDVSLKSGLVYLNPALEVYTDCELFALTAGRALQEADPANPATTDLLEQAAELYQGDFLPDNPYDDWAAGRRGGFRQLYLRVLAGLIASYRARGRVEQAVAACHRYLALEPAEEKLVRTAMEMLWQSGRKQRALALYRELAAVLERDFDTVPEAATTGLYEKIRSV